MVRPRAWHALLLLPLAGVTAWLVVRGRTAREDPATVLSALRQAAGPALPDPIAAGATARSDPAAYTRDTLYEYIDGAAEAYLSNGFERCVAATYTFASEAGQTLDVTAEVYRFKAPDGARQQMEAERPANSKPLPGMPDAFADDTTLVSVRGGDYLKLTALGAGASSPKALAAVAGAWMKAGP